MVSIATGASFSNLYYVTLEDIDLISRMNVHTLYRGSEGNDLKIYYKDGCIYIQSRYSGSPSCIQPLVNNGITSIVNNVDFDKSNMIEASYQ